MEIEKQILEKLNNIEAMLLEQSSMQKDVLAFNEALKYLSVSASHLYKLTSSSRIPHSKPQGKKVNFSRAELNKWLLANPIKTVEEIDREASTAVFLKNKRY